MGNLRDQLKNAKLLSKKDAKRLAHEERVHHKKIGGAKGAEEERAARQAELEETKEGQRAADKQREADRKHERDRAAEVAACEELLRREVRAPGRKGASRWYFQTADGAVPCLELPLTERMQLSEGSLCIVRRGPASSHDYGLLDIGHGRRVAAILADRVAWAAPGALPAVPS